MPTKRRQSKKVNIKSADSAGAIIADPFKALQRLVDDTSSFRISFLVRKAGPGWDEVGFDSQVMDWCGGGCLPDYLNYGSLRKKCKTIRHSLIELAKCVKSRKVRFDSITVDVSRVPEHGIEQVRNWVIQGISQAFHQRPPRPVTLEAAARKYQKTLEMYAAAQVVNARRRI